MKRMLNLTVHIRTVLSMLILTSGLVLVGCSGGDSSSQACSTTTTADSSGNPITTVTCDNG